MYSLPETIHNYTQLYIEPDNMTVNQHATWRGASVYRNPNVLDSPVSTLPNNVVGTVRHFSKKRLLRKYAVLDYACNGIPVMTEPELFDFWCVIKSPTSRTKINTVVPKEAGDVVEGEWLLFYDPFHPAHPATGLHLDVSGDRSIDSEYRLFSDVIEYQNALWIVTAHQRIDIDYGDNDKLYIGKANLARWAEPSHNSIADERVGLNHYALK